MIIPYSFFIDIHPESGVRSSGSILWAYSTYEPYNGLVLFPSVGLVVFFILTSIPSILFLYVKDQKPQQSPLGRLFYDATILTLVLVIASAILLPILGESTPIIIAIAWLTSPVYLVFVLVPTMRSELLRRASETERLWLTESPMQQTTSDESGRIGYIMFTLALFSPQSILYSWSYFTLYAPTWMLYLSYGLDTEIWFAIHPVSTFLLYSVLYILSFVFAYKVWMTIRGLGRESTTIIVGILSLVVAALSSITSVTFILPLPFPLQFCIGLYFLSKFRRLARIEGSNSS